MKPNFWLHLSLASRIKILLICVVAALAALQMFAFTRFFVNDKTAYLLDANATKTESLAASLARILMIEAANPNSEQDLELSALAEKPARLPQQGEVHFGLGKGGTSILLARSASGTVVARRFDLSAAAQAIDVAQEMSGVVALQHGVPLASIGGFPLKGDKSALPLGRLRTVLREGLSSGQSIQTDPNGNRWVVSYAEIPNTNLLVYSEIALAELYGPMRSFLLQQGLTALLSLVVVVLLVQWILGSLTRPISALVEVFRAIGKGTLPRKWPLNLKEFEPVGEAVMAMSAEILSRQEELRSNNAALASILLMVERHKGNIADDPMGRLALVVPSMAGIMSAHLVGHFPAGCYLRLETLGKGKRLAQAFVVRGSGHTAAGDAQEANWQSLCGAPWARQAPGTFSLVSEEHAALAQALTNQHAPAFLYCRVEDSAASNIIHFILPATGSTQSYS